MIRRVELTDDLNRVAHLIYQTDGFIFPFLFGKPKKAENTLFKLVGMENNSFSYKNIYAYFDEDMINGILIETNPNQNQHEEKDFTSALNPFQLISLGFKQIVLFPILRHHHQGRYIQNVAVDAPYRGQGIGRKLLEDAIERAKRDQIKTLELDVAVENKRAKKLYDNLGFNVVKKGRIWGIFLATFAMKKQLK